MKSTIKKTYAQFYPEAHKTCQHANNIHIGISFSTLRAYLGIIEMPL